MRYETVGSVAEIQTGPFGSQLHKEDYVEMGTPIVTVEHLGKRKMTAQNLPYVSDDDRIRLFKYCLCDGDIVFSRVGSVDRCSYVSAEEDGWMFSGRCLRVRSVPNKIFPLYLYYFFNIETTKQHIRSVAVGATMPSINTKLLSNIPVPLPELSAQKAIAAVLSALDDKIELNNRINKNLEAQAQAIFKSWFVDFEPFRDGEFVDSELGPIPKGWRVGHLTEIGTIIGGATPSKQKDEYYTQSKKGIAWITPKDLSINKSKFISHGEIDITDLGYRSASTKLMPAGSVLFSSRAPIGYMAIADNELCTNQGFKSIIPEKLIGTSFVYYTLKSNLDTIQNLGSGSTFKEVSGGVMKSLRVLIPDLHIVNKFNNICKSLLSKQRSLEYQNQTLASIRDTLLPKLMSGEIRVPLEV